MTRRDYAALLFVSALAATGLTAYAGSGSNTASDTANTSGWTSGYDSGEVSDDMGTGVTSRDRESAGQVGESDSMDSGYDMPGMMGYDSAYDMGYDDSY